MCWCIRLAAFLHFIVFVLVSELAVSQPPAGPPETILLQLLEPFDQADEREANGTTGVQVISLPIELSLSPIDAVLESDIEVVVSVVGGTAEVIRDFNISETGENQATIILPAGMRHEQFVNISLTIADDLFVEEVETIILLASTQPGLSVSFGQNRRTITILDDDVRIGFTQRSYEVNEGGGSVMVCAQLMFGQFRNPDFATFRIDTRRIIFETSPGIDYEDVNELVTLHRITRQVCRNIDIIDDTLVETAMERFRVNLRLVDFFGVDVRFMPGRTTVFIIDNDSSPLPAVLIIGFQQIHYKVSEGVGCVRVCVEILRGQLKADDSISFGLITEELDSKDPMRAVAGMDFEPPPPGARLTFREGNMNAPLCKEIQILDDCETENLEAFDVFITNVTAVGVSVTVDPEQTRVKIIDNDDIAITFIMLPLPLQGDERRVGPVSIPIQILLSPVNARLQSNITVSVKVLGGSATGGQDYVLSLPLVVFPAGTSNGKILNAVLSVKDDQIVESKENVVLVGYTEPGVKASFTPQQDRSTLTIHDNDVVVGFQQVHYKVSEDEGCVRVCLEITAGQLKAGDSISFSLTTRALSARSEDFEDIPEATLLIFREGNMNRPLCKEIQIIDDDEDEALVEEFLVNVANNEVVGVQATFNPSTTTVKIIDDDEEQILPSPTMTPGMQPTAMISMSTGPQITPTPNPGGVTCPPPSCIICNQYGYGSHMHYTTASSKSTSPGVVTTPAPSTTQPSLPTDSSNPCDVSPCNTTAT